MSDLESGLRQAVESARRPHLVTVEPVTKNMTAMHVMAAMQTLGERMHAQCAEMNKLKSLLAGPGDDGIVGVHREEQPTIFDGMGQEILQLTRIVEAMEALTAQSLAAVRS